MLAPMDWVYKATTAKIDCSRTAMLADVRGFLCRSAYLENGTWVSNVREVAAGDILHFYCIPDGRRVGELGSFEMIGPEAHPQPECFGDRVDGTAPVPRQGPVVHQAARGPRWFPAGPRPRVLHRMADPEAPRVTVVVHSAG